MIALWPTIRRGFDAAVPIVPGFVNRKVKARTQLMIEDGESGFDPAVETVVKSRSGGGAVRADSEIRKLDVVQSWYRSAAEFVDDLSQTD